MADDRYDSVESEYTPKKNLFREKEKFYRPKTQSKCKPCVHVGGVVGVPRRRYVSACVYVCMVCMCMCACVCVWLCASQCSVTGTARVGGNRPRKGQNDLELSNVIDFANIENNSEYNKTLIKQIGMSARE